MKTIKARVEQVTQMINNKQLDQAILRQYYDKYYQVSIGDTKLPTNEITHFKIGVNPKFFDTVSLIVCYKNGVESTISKRFLCGAKRSKKRDVCRALRESVVSQILDYRFQNNISKDYEIDHVYPFNSLFNDFIKTIDKKDYDSIKIIDNVLTPSFIIHDFVKYHKEKAVLQPLTKKENMSKGKKIPKDLYNMCGSCSRQVTYCKCLTK